jgi:Mlc titration factor MtfA (ptsG expression regulator)
MIYIFLIVLLVAIATWFLFRGKGKPVVISNEKQENNFRELLSTHVKFYQNLDDAGQNRFEQLLAEFLTVTHIEGVGTEITDLDRVLIASSAVIPIFGFPEWQYNNLTNVILYPDTFDGKFQFEGENRNILGMVGSGYMNGQMLLSRAALTKGFSASAGKENAAIHEFVHLLDKSDGTVDGIPENLLAQAYTIPWLHMIHQEMHRIQSGKSDINPYALTNEAEFFAVAAEYFFEKPQELQHKHPELYAQLCLVFGQHPAILNK